MTPNIEDSLVACEQDLIQLKTIQNTRADGVQWYRTSVDLGAPPQSSTQSTQKQVVEVLPLGTRGNIIIMPILHQGYNLSTESMGGIQLTQYDSIGKLLLDPTNPRKFTVSLLAAGTLSTISESAHIGMEIFSNCELIVTRNERITL